MDPATPEKTPAKRSEFEEIAKLRERLLPRLDLKLSYQQAQAKAPQAEGDAGKTESSTKAPTHKSVACQTEEADSTAPTHKSVACQTGEADSTAPTHKSVACQTEEADTWKHVILFSTKLTIPVERSLTNENQGDPDRGVLGTGTIIIKKSTKGDEIKFICQLVSDKPLKPSARKLKFQSIFPDAERPCGSISKRRTPSSGTLRTHREKKQCFADLPSPSMAGLKCFPSCSMGLMATMSW